MKIEEIVSLDDPRLDVYRDLKTRNRVRDEQLFIAEGPTVVERVLRSNFDVRSVLISDRKMDSFGDRLPTDLPVYRLSNALAQQLVGFAFHCGVMACAHRKPSPSLDDVISQQGPQLILAGDRILDPENVGALIRIASAFGAQAVLFGRGSADPFSRRVLRVSMGNVLFLPIIETENLPVELQDLAERGFENCATILDPHAAPLSRHQFSHRTTLVFGNEYDGVSAEVLDACQTRLTIPMLNGTDSLNVAVSSGIFSYGFRAQHPSEQGCDL